MKNKKGFTLIELLAVIIILGLLVVIAFPAISKYLIDTKSDTYSLHEAELKSATANMMSVCVQGNVEDCVPENGESRTIYLKELIAQKYSDSIKDPERTDHYCSETDTYVVVTNSNNNVVNLDYQVCLVCSEYKSPICETVKPNDTCDKESDPERPVCGEAVGSSTVWTNADRIISIGCSDTGCGCTQGTFYQRFNENTKQGVITVVDKAGNATDCVVDVYVDKEIPTCELTVEGNLGENGWYGGSAPVVKLKYNSSDISGIATYGMGVSSKNYDLNKKTSYTVTPGITTVYGYVKDNAGNVGTCKTEVKYDNVVPTSEITYGYQVYPKDDIATVSGQNIVLNNFISEYGTVLGANIYLKSNTGGMSVTIYKGSTEIAKRTISAGVKFMKFSFSGNYDGLTIDMGSSSNIALIERVELITDQTVNGFYSNKDVIVYASSKDSFSGKGYYSFDDNAWQTDSSYTYGSNVSKSNVKIKDYAGNVSDPVYFDITNIDKEVPSCYITTEFAPDGKNDWFTKNFGLDLHTSDIGVSDVRDYNITTNSNPSYTTVKKGTQTEDTKLTTWHGYVRDHAGNVNRCSIDVKLDKVDPVCEILPRKAPDGENNWYISTVDIYYTEKDDTAGIVFRGMNTTGTVDYNMDTVMTLDYDTTGQKFYCYVEDESGRTNTDNDSFKRDIKDPTCVITPDRAIDGENGWYIKDVKLTFSTDSETSPIVGYDFINSKTFSYTNKRTTHTVTKSTEGVTYYGYAKEESGRTSTCELFVKMDEDKPSCTLTDPGANGENGWYVGNIKFTLNPTDNFDDNIKSTGIVGSNTKTYNGKKELTHTEDKTNIQYWGFVEDDAGNENYCVSEIEKKDATQPDACTLTITSGTPGKRGWYVTNVGLGISTTIDDNLSGVQGYDIVASGATPTYSHNHSTHTVTANSTSTSGTDYVASIKDNAGNVRTCSVNVKKDDDPPDCYFIKTGTPGLNGWYRSEVNFSLKVSDNTGREYSDLYQYGVSASSSVTYNSRTNYTQSGETAGKDVFCFVEDQAGNTGSNDETVKIDYTAPACMMDIVEGTPGNNGWYISNVKLAFVNANGTATMPVDTLSGMYRYNISTSKTSYSYFRRYTTTIAANTPSEGRMYYGFVQDMAGNVNSCEKLIKKDTTKPICSITASGTEGENGWFRSNVTLTTTPSDTYSGVSSFDLTSSSSPSYNISYSSQTSATVYATSETSGTTYHCYVKDVAGNVNDTSANAYPDPTALIKIDKTKPSCSLKSRWKWGFLSGGWQSGGGSFSTLGGGAEVAFESKTGATSFGMARGSTIAVYNGIETMSLQRNSGVFYGFVKDDAGNTGMCSASVTHSNTFGGGTCTLSFSGTLGDNGWYTSGGYVSMSASKDTDNVKKFKYEIVDQYGNETTVEESRTAYIGTDGKYYVTGDYGGISCSMTINKDGTAPTNFSVDASRSSSLSNPSNSYIYVTLSASDATSGVAKWQYYYNSTWYSRYSTTSPIKFYYYGTGNHSRYYRVCDAAGNCTGYTYQSIVIDPCNGTLLEENFGEWTSCSEDCGEGTRTRVNVWTGNSGATCRRTVEESCTGTEGCTSASDICKYNGGDDGAALFGSSIGYFAGYKNFGAFTTVAPEYGEAGFLCSPCGEWTTSGYPRICANSSTCGDYFGVYAGDILNADYADDGNQDCYFKRYWCICDQNKAIDNYYYGGNFVSVYNAWYGG